MSNQGYDGPLPPYYIQSSSPQTPNVGFTIAGMDPILAYNFVLADAAIGSGGTSVKVNGSTVNNPNFNGTTPAAPGGSTNVTFQVSGSSVSAYLTGGGGTPALPFNSVQFNNSGAFGGDSTLEWSQTLKGLGIGSSAVPGQFDAIAGFGTPFGSSLLDVAQSVSTLPADGSVGNIVSGIEANPASSVIGTATSYYAAYMQTSSNASNANDINKLSGIFFEADHLGSGHVAVVHGFELGAFNDGSGTVGSMKATSIISTNAGSGLVTEINGAYIQTGAAVVSAVVTTDKSIFIDSPFVDGTLTHHYGIYIASQNGGGGNNPDPWGIFSVSGRHFFGDTIDTGTGYRIGGAAASGRFLRGDGTNFVSNTIQSGDLPNTLGLTIAISRVLYSN